MAAVTNDLRNRQLVAAVVGLRSKGEIVFVLCGSSHAACILPALPIGQNGAIMDDSGM